MDAASAPESAPQWVRLPLKALWSALMWSSGKCAQYVACRNLQSTHILTGTRT
jgi:hypothetical protein